MRILVVDDDEAVRESIRLALEVEGYDVEVAGDGLDALASVAAAAPDAIVLDVLMPTLDGLEACRRLRRGGDRTPILMLTARDLVSDRVVGLDAGADDYVPKPFALDELLARLRALLRRSGRGDRSSSPTSRSIRGRERCIAASGGSSSRAPSSTCSRRSFSTRGKCSRARRSPTASGATTSARGRTRSRSTSATCGGRPKPAGSRA
jgi:DNA-binding response OmpR family regulator